MYPQNVVPKINFSPPPSKLKPYLFHGVGLIWSDRENAIGDCPFCGREGHFSVEVSSGLWRCLACGQGTKKGGGNAYTFLRMLWEYSLGDPKDLEPLARDRHIKAIVLHRWGVVRSITSGLWLVPAHNAETKLVQLYKYDLNPKGQRVLLATPKINKADYSHGLFGVHLYDQAKPRVYLCEGPWDAMALWNILGYTRDVGKGFRPTTNVDASMLSNSSVLAVPGCNTFSDSWLPLFEGKTVVLLFDNDHPRKDVRGNLIPPAGYAAMERLGGRISAVAESVSYIHWGDGGYDQDLPSGFDVRDNLERGKGE